MQKKKKIDIGDELNKTKEENIMLQKNFIWMKEQAEKSGTEKNYYKKQFILLQEKYNKLLLQVKK